VVIRSSICVMLPLGSIWDSPMGSGDEFNGDPSIENKSKSCVVGSYWRQRANPKTTSDFSPTRDEDEGYFEKVSAHVEDGCCVEVVIKEFSVENNLHLLLVSHYLVPDTGLKSWCMKIVPDSVPNVLACFLQLGRYWKRVMGT
jgi:hypothetical protein